MALTKVSGPMTLAGTVSVFDFMTPAEITAVKTNTWTTEVPDVTAAVQAALDNRNMIGGTINFPSGTYKINNSLLLWNTADANSTGIALRGEGPYSTIIESHTNNSPLFDIRGTKSFTSGGTGSTFFNGGGIYNMSLDGTYAVGDADAINVQGWQYGEISNCYITKFLRDGIRQWVDTGFSSADYSSSSIDIVNTTISDCAGQGVNQTGAIGAWSWKFNKVAINYCGMGATISSGGNSFIDCSFMGNGYSPAGTMRLGGSHLQIGVISGGAADIIIQGCEFDFARLAHVKVDYCSRISISRSRFIFNDRFLTGALTPSVGGVVLAAAGVDSNVQLLTIDSCITRVDTAGVCNAFLIANTANVQGVQVIGGIFTNTGGATLNKYVGFTSGSNYNLINDYSVIEHGIAPEFIQGRPRAEYIGQCSSPIVPTSAIIIFGTQETLNNQIFGTTLYNTSTGIFTCPITGYYSIDFMLSVIGATPAEYYQIYPRKNAVNLTEWQFTGTGLSRTMMIARYYVFCTAGDTLDIYNNGADGKTITGVYSQIVIKLVN